MNQKSSCLSVSAEISRGKLEENLSGFYDISQRMTDLGGGDTVSEVRFICGKFCVYQVTKF